MALWLMGFQMGESGLQCHSKSSRVIKTSSSDIQYRKTSRLSSASKKLTWTLENKPRPICVCTAECCRYVKWCNDLLCLHIQTLFIEPYWLFRHLRPSLTNWRDQDTNRCLYNGHFAKVDRTEIHR